MKECWTALTMILFVENNLSESLWILQEKKGDMFEIFALFYGNKQMEL